MKGHKHFLYEDTKLKETLQRIFLNPMRNFHVQIGKDHRKQLKNLNKLNIYIEQHFSNIGRQAMWESDPWEIERKKSEIDSCPGLLLRENFQPQFRKRETRWSLVISLNWGDSSVSQGSPRHLELQSRVLKRRWCNRGKSSKNLQEVLLESSAQYWSVHMHEETTQN